MLSIAVCDSEKNELNITSACVAEWIRLRQDTPRAEVKVFEDPSELVAKTDIGSGFDIYILDIDMPGIDGIAVGKIIRRKNRDVPIIYVTRSPDHALEAYGIRAARYLLKPLRYSEIKEALDFSVMMINALPKRSYMIKNAGTSTSVDSGDIVYIENNVRNMRFFMRDGSVINGTRRNVSFEESLSYLFDNGGFIQTHKSFVVNMKYISSLTKDSVTLSSGISIPISRRHSAAVREAYEGFISG